ncbi:MAG TPA: ROK family protein [Candidatus Saccharimonadales bacterium]|jgi:glucokinase|nr:ROK family protein [Candidatus Saccharimonadales bacterium]
MKSTMIVTVDTGATKTLIADFDVAGVKRQEARFATPKNEQEFLDTLVSTLQHAYPDASMIDAICIALPGMIIPGGILKLAPNLGWRDVAVRKQLGKYYSCPIFIENDANLAGLAEAQAQPKIPKVSLYLTVSTGIGAGIIINGRLLPEHRSSEVGHMVLEYDGMLREWESFASGRAILAKYGQYARDIDSDETWNEIADMISRGLLALIPALRPDLIIFGGSIGTYFEKYQPHLESILHEHFDHLMIAVPQMVQAQHPEEAVIYGCYHYATHKLAS